MQPWNRRLKLIASALRLQRADVARATTLGGSLTTNSTAHAWLSAPAATTTGVRGQTLRKNREMSEAEFDAFVAGLRQLLMELESQDD